VHARACVRKKRAHVWHARARACARACVCPSLLPSLPPSCAYARVKCTREARGGTRFASCSASSWGVSENLPSSSSLTPFFVKPGEDARRLRACRRLDDGQGGSHEGARRARGGVCARHLLRAGGADGVAGQRRLRLELQPAAAKAQAAGAGGQQTSLGAREHCRGLEGPVGGRPHPPFPRPEQPLHRRQPRRQRTHPHRVSPGLRRLGRRPTSLTARWPGRVKPELRVKPPCSTPGPAAWAGPAELHSFPGRRESRRRPARKPAQWCRARARALALGLRGRGALRRGEGDAGLERRGREEERRRRAEPAGGLPPSAPPWEAHGLAWTSSVSLSRSPLLSPRFEFAWS